MSIYVREIGQQTPLIDHYSDIPRNPASVMKMVTTLAGLEILGPNYTWYTKVFADGQIAGDTLKGDLIIKGNGDPFLVKESFWHILHVLQEKGVCILKGI